MQRDGYGLLGGAVKLAGSGFAYEYLIQRFAAGAGKKAGEFYTPSEVSELIAELVAPQPGERICDPACGSGSLLIRCGEQVKKQGSIDFSLFGQEITGDTRALAKMNMFLHSMDNARIDASREYQDGKNQNKLRRQDLDKIVSAYKARQSVDKYTYLATFDEIKENDFNLNIPRYVDTFEEEEEIDINAVQADIDRLENELVQVRSEMAGYLKELGYG